MRHRIPLLLLLLIIPITFIACDSFFGLREREVPVVDDKGQPVVDPETGKQKTKIVIEQSPTSPASILGGLLTTIFPPAAVIFGLGRWAYTEIRSRRLDHSAKAMIVGVKNAVAGGDAALTREKLYGSITAASNLYANRSFFKGLVARVKALFSGAG